MKTIYIAGPYRAADAWRVEQNIRHAEDVGWLVGNAGAVPVVPHSMYRFWNGTLTDEFWLQATEELLRRCDAILLIDGWEKSSGARNEARVADEEMQVPSFLEPAIRFRSSAQGEAFSKWLTTP